MYRVAVLTEGKEYVLYDIFSDDEQIYNDELSEEMGKTATFSFAMAPNHPNIGKIIPLSSEVRIYQDEKKIFWGRAVTPSADIYNTLTVECVGGLSYLADSLQAPFTISGSGTNFLQQLLNVHNSQVEEYKQLQLGQINVAVRDAERTLETYSDTLSVLTSLLVNNYGGYFRVREGNDGTRYLDYLTNYGGTNSQEIRFGENILDLSSQIDASEIVTILIPEGAELEDGTKVNITSVNGGLNYISDNTAVGKWGRIWGYAEFSDISDPAELLTEARKYLTNLTAFPQTINLTAFDLSYVDTDIESLNLGYWTNFISAPHGLQGTYLLQKLTRHLTAPQNDQVTFGIVRTTISGQTANTSQIVTQKVEQVKQQLGKEIDEKIENATKLITGGTGGYFVIGLNDDGQPNETFWMDSPSTETATNVIRMNQNGIGFSTTGINGPYKNAWTIDGNLVADFITAGTMLADRIRGGNLEVGGTGLGKDGTIIVKDMNGTIIAQIDKNGITMKSGSINLGEGTLQINSDGSIAITKGTISLGAFKVDSNGVMELDGTSNSSTIGCTVFNAVNAHISSSLEVEGNTFVEGLTAQDMLCHGEIQCEQIYSSVAGEWWSDRRLKKNIKTIPNDVCLEIIKRLRPVSFVFKDSNINSVGFIAQEVKQVLRSAGTKLPLIDKHDGYFCIPYAVYVAVLAGAVQAQQKEIDILKGGRKHGKHNPGDK